MGNKQLKASPSKGNIKAPGYLASVLPFLEPGDGVPELEAYLRANPDQQLTVAQELANQSVDPQFRRNVVTLGALRILRLLTISHEHNVVLCAVHALGNIAADTANHETMVQDGCFYNIIDLLSSGKVDLQCKAARAITNLTVTTDNKYHFDQLGAIGALIKLAQNSDENCRAEAIAALGNLAVEDELELKIGQQGGIEVVHACLGRGGRVLQEHADRAIRNLTNSESNQLYYEEFKTNKKQQQQQQQQQHQALQNKHSTHLSRDIAASVGNWFDNGIDLGGGINENDDSSEDDDDTDYQQQHQQQPAELLSGYRRGDTVNNKAADGTNSEWRQLMDPTSQRPYWYNVQTQQSSWTPPSLPAPRPPAASTPTPATIQRQHNNNESSSSPITYSPTHSRENSAASTSPHLVVSVPPPLTSPPPNTTASAMSNLSIEQALSLLPSTMTSSQSPRSQTKMKRGHGRAGTVVDRPHNYPTSPPPQQQQQQTRHNRAETIAPPALDNIAAPPSVHVAHPPSPQAPSVPPPRVPAGRPPQQSVPSISPTHTQLPPRRTTVLPSEPHPIEQLSNISKQVANAINLVRTKPLEFAQRIRSMQNKVGNNGILKMEVTSIQTTEGTIAYDEAIALLSHMRPMSPLEISSSMSLANQKHALDLGNSGETGHEGSDGSKPSERLRQSGGIISGGGKVSEGIEFGPWQDGEDFVIALLVGDGEPTRTHRRILLDPNAGACGVAVTKHKTFGNVCVVTLASNCELSPSKRSSAAATATTTTTTTTMSPLPARERYDTMQNAQTLSLPPKPNTHTRHNTLHMAQSMTLPSIAESSSVEEEDNRRRDTMHVASSIPFNN